MACTVKVSVGMQGRGSALLSDLHVRQVGGDAGSRPLPRRQAQVSELGFLHSWRSFS